MSFSTKLIKLRKSMGLSQEDLANEINVTRQTISKWELGTTIPDMEKLKLISNYFGVSVDELISENESNENEYINNNLSLCESNCSFNGYNNAKKKALCKCEKKIEIGLITDIIKNEEILSNDFNSIDDTNSNLATMKCIDTLFSKNGLLTNIGSYLLLFSLYL